MMTTTATTDDDDSPHPHKQQHNFHHPADTVKLATTNIYITFCLVLLHSSGNGCAKDGGI
jgi:hypothetical protein